MSHAPNHRRMAGPCKALVHSTLPYLCRAAIGTGVRLSATSWTGCKPTPLPIIQGFADIAIASDEMRRDLASFACSFWRVDRVGEFSHEWSSEHDIALRNSCDVR